MTDKTKRTNAADNIHRTPALDKIGLEIHVAVYRVRPLIVDKLHKLRDPAVAQAVKDRWLAEPVVAKRTTMRQSIEARLVELDGEEGSLDWQVRGAMRLAASEQPGVAVEAERVLSKVNTIGSPSRRHAKGSRRS